MEVGGKHQDTATLPQEWTLVPTEYEAGWAAEPVLMFWSWKNLLVLLEFIPRITQPIASCHTK